jgi:hypothetical protein
VLLNGSKSGEVPVQSGGPVGSVLGPLLFLLFINDLPNYVSPESTTRIIADDCALYRTIHSEQDAKTLQQDLDGLQRWEKDWLMEFHPQKCQILHKTNKGKPIRQPYNIHGHILEEVDKSKYLGLNYQKSLNWNHHIDLITKKANNATSFQQRNIHQCPRRTKELCLMTLVRPLVEIFVLSLTYTNKYMPIISMYFTLFYKCLLSICREEVRIESSAVSRMNISVLRR